jgi:AraC family transcriptional regulator, exoenzyme S synthesis regulatory protein ExsA
MIIEQTELRYRGKVVFERVVMSTGFKRIPKLFLEDEACFLFLTKGAFHFRTPTQFLNLNEGDAMLSKCGNYFMENVMINQKSEHRVISAIGAFFYPEMVKGFFRTDLTIQPFQNNFDTKKISVAPLMKPYMDSIGFMLDNPGIADEDLVGTKLKELLLLLSKSENSESINSFVNSLFVPCEYDFNDIIQKNLYSNLTIRELAHLSNLSLATFKRKFKELYKLSPARYILQKKLVRAVHLLQYETKPVSEIAWECGFGTVSNFNKAFKRHFEKSPTEFRLSQKDKKLSHREN